jgi:N-acetylneuraminic acid mutarotase
MKKTILIVLILTKGVASMGLAAEDTWTTKSPMPTARSHLSASVVDGKIYTIGGCTQAVYQEYLSTVEAYDIATDTWIKKADLPTGRARLSTSVVNSKIYAIGGSPHPHTDLSTVEVYDPATDNWTRKADMPTARCWLSTCVVNGKIYAFGGKIESSATMVSTVEEYDPVSNIWIKKADMPTARMALSTNVVNGKIYAIGGVAAGGGAGPSLSTVEVYDPSTNTWTKKANMPTARANASAGALNGKIYVIGGSTGWSTVFSTLEVYDSATDTWAKGPDMPTARSAGPSAGVVDGKVYVIGGFVNPSNWAPTAAVEVYDPGLVTPPPDFNGDGIVNMKDFSKLAQYWQQAERLVDIAPPIGNGIVDIQDVTVLGEYWLKEVLPASLIAYWKLDETEGFVAHDSVGDYDALVLTANPLWRPTDGKIDGALELDGIDDYVSTPFVVGAVDAPFSVFAWVKGGSPGQVVVSQRGVPGVGWLATDPSDGSLITDYPGLLGRSLASETVVADGQWHRVGLVWDPPDRILYIDDVQVASDKHPLLGGSDGGLYIGAGSDLAPGTFFSGLVDDVKIYNQAILP